MKRICNKQVLYYILALCFPILAAKAQTSSVELTQFPKSLQLFPRDATSNYARVEIAGKNSSQQPLFLRRYTNQIQDYTVPIGQDSLFNFVDSLYAQLAMTRYELLNQDGLLIHSADSVVAGDFFLFNGQSNAEAGKVDSSASAYINPYIRTYGSGNENGYSDLWYICSGDGKRWTNGSIGQLALVFAHQYMLKNFVPVSILNCAEGGREIRYFLRNPQDTIVRNNFNRTLVRCRLAGALHHIRSLIWYQGEQDAKNEMPGSQYMILLQQLVDDYSSHYPNLKHYFMFQIRKGCSTSAKPIGEIQGAQSDLDALEENIHLISTNYAEHDGCHFYLAGYRRLAERLLRQINFYSDQNFTEKYPDSPTMQGIHFRNDSSLVVTVRDAALPLHADGDAANDFKIERDDIKPYWISTVDNQIILHFNQSISGAYKLSYSGHSGPAYPGIFDANQSGIMSFYEVPISAAEIQTPPIVQNIRNDEFWTICWLHDSMLEVQYLGNQQTVFVQMEILNSVGMPLDKFKIKLNRVMHLPADRLSSGIYYLKIQTGKTIKVLPFNKM